VLAYYHANAASAAPSVDIAQSGSIDQHQPQTPPGPDSQQVTNSA
jgi:hypothetical protein